MERALRWILLLAVMVFMLGVGFTAGVVFDRNVGNIAVTGNGENPDEDVNTELIQEAYDIIERQYVDQDAVDGEELTYGAVAGMVDTLGDTGHSRFLTPEMLRSQHTAIQGEFEGIGALVEEKDGYPTIVTPFDDSPAQKAGLEPGDIILEVDGEEVYGQGLSEVISKIIGPAGTQVTLTIQDPDTGDTREVTITRARIEIENVTWTILPGTNIAHIRLAQFSQGVTDDLKRAVREAKRQGAEAIIFDLRNNPGGLLNEAIGIVSQFIPAGDTVLQVRDAQGNVTELQAERGGVALDIPLVVLINQGTASAAEITSGAVQDYNRGQVVGMTTFGTGTVLNEFRLEDGSALLLATQEWLTPDGRVIWHEGIVPDIEVELPEGVHIAIPETVRDLSAAELQNIEDPQLLKAIELLQQ